MKIVKNTQIADLADVMTEVSGAKAKEDVVPP